LSTKIDPGNQMFRLGGGITFWEVPREIGCVLCKIVLYFNDCDVIKLPFGAETYVF